MSHNYLIIKTIFLWFQVQLVVEGELKKRQQLCEDVEQIGQWIEKTTKETEDRVSGAVELEDDFIEV